jgi:transcriptional regulator with XRE-family HTH domain
MEQAAIVLKRLRERAGLSMEKMANALGYKKPSGYQYYESVDKFKKETLPLDMVEGLIKILAGKGDPPITAREVFELSGISQDRLLELYILTNAPDAPIETPNIPSSSNDHIDRAVNRLKDDIDAQLASLRQDLREMISEVLRRAAKGGK